MGKYGFSFSWKRALGITALKQKFARETGIPTSVNGIEKKSRPFGNKLDFRRIV